MRAGFLALAVSLALTPCVIWLAHRVRLIDVPNSRSLHTAPTPRAGGLAVMASVVASSLTFEAGHEEIVALCVGGVVLGLVGLIDDRRGLPPIPRLLAQLLMPVALSLAIVDRSLPLLLASTVIAALLVSAYVNAFNFMDGINGISAMQAVVVSISLAIVLEDTESPQLVSASLAAAGASLGFLPYNSPRALSFLGDVGSYFLGFWLAALGLLALDSGASLLVVISPFLLYLLDTGSVLVRRASRGASLFEAHREHTYQRLVQLGHSHLGVATTVALIPAACFLLMWVVSDRETWIQVSAFGACLALVAAYLAAPSVLSRRDTEVSR